MMNDLLQILGRAGTIAAFFDRDEPENMHRIVAMYWRVLLVLLILALAASISWGLTRLSAAVEEPDVSPRTTGTLGFQREELQSTLGAYQARAANYSNFRTNGVGIAEPR